MKLEKNECLPKLNGLSSHIKKAIEKNTTCDENLVRELKDVEVKRKAALNEIILKKEAFRKQQLKWQQRLPAGYKSSQVNNPVKSSQVNAIGQQLRTVSQRNGGLVSSGSCLLPGALPRMGKRRNLPTLPTATPTQKHRLNDELESQEDAHTAGALQRRPGQRNPSRDSVWDFINQTTSSTEQIHKQTNPEEKEEYTIKATALRKDSSDESVQSQHPRNRRRSFAPYDADGTASLEVTLRPRLRQRRRTLHDLFQTFNCLDEDTSILDLAQSSLTQLQCSFPPLLAAQTQRNLSTGKEASSTLVCHVNNCERGRKELQCYDDQNKEAVHEGILDAEPAPKYNRRCSVQSVAPSERKSSWPLLKEEPAQTELVEEKDGQTDNLRQRLLKRQVSFQESDYIQ